jgi:hypothetical protein
MYFVLSLSLLSIGERVRVQNYFVSLPHNSFLSLDHLLLSSSLQEIFSKNAKFPFLSNARQSNQRQLHGSGQWEASCLFLLQAALRFVSAGWLSFIPGTPQSTM